jgi:hypothetical protein
MRRVCQRLDDDRRSRAAPVDVVDTDDVGQEDPVQLAAFRQARQTLPVFDRVVLGRVIARCVRVAITAELSAPTEAARPRGLVVVAYGSDGLTNNLSGPWATMIRDYAGLLARAGFVATECFLIPALGMAS